MTPENEYFYEGKTCTARCQYWTIDIEDGLFIHGYYCSKYGGKLVTHDSEMKSARVERCLKYYKMRFDPNVEIG